MKTYRVQIKDNLNRVVYMRYINGEERVYNATITANKLCRGMQILGKFQANNDRLPLHTYRVVIKEIKKGEQE